MQTKIFLEREDRVSGTDVAITLGDAELYDIALFFPIDPEQRLRLCSQFSEAIQAIHNRALKDARDGSPRPAPVESL